MSEDKQRQPDTRDETRIAEALRLRADPPRVMRLSRRALSVLTALGALGLGAILIAALQERKPVEGPSELYSTERIQEAEGLSHLPADYTHVPQLGPPLPGELGRPILSAQRRGEAVTPPIAASPAADPVEQLRRQEEETARLAPLFAEVRTAAPENHPPSTQAAASRSAGLQGLFPSRRP